jgi:hypothetical protein
VLCMMCRSVSGENEFDGRAASSKPLRLCLMGVLRYKR